MPFVSPTDHIGTERSAAGHERDIYTAGNVNGSRVERDDILCVERDFEASDVDAQYFVGRLAAVIKRDGDYYARFYDTDGSKYGPTHPLEAVEQASDDLVTGFETKNAEHVTVTEYVDGEKITV